MPDLKKPRIVVIGVGGAGGNAVNNMIAAGLAGVQFVAANTDTQALAASRAEHKIQLGSQLTDGLGAGSKPEIGEAAAEEALEEITALINNAHMVFIAAGMGGGTGTGAAYVVARAAKEMGILSIAVVTKPFQFEGLQRMRNADAGISALTPHVDTLLVIPNENLFRVATDRTTFAEAFIVADQVLYSGIACLVDLIVEEGLINLDLADVRAVLGGMGAAMMGTGEASGEQRAVVAAEEAIVNPLLDNITLKGAKSLLLSISGGRDLTLWEVDEAANRVRQEVDPEANIIVGAILDEDLGDTIRVSIVASGMPRATDAASPAEAEAPVWSPRSQMPPGQAASPEAFGSRLSEAITERTVPGRAAAGSRTRGKGRSTAGNGKLREGPPRLSRQSPAARSRNGGGGKGRAAREPSEPRPAQPQALESGGAVGWPEHWAKAGEAAGRAREAAARSPPPLVVPARPAEALPRRAKLLQRLAGLVGSKRET
jgi:cell division protein FtsZ